MKELFSEPDFTRVGYFQTVLEAEGIQTFVRNQNVSAAEVLVPVFYPALCVVNDEDYDRAMEILKTHAQQDAVLSQQEVTCPKCGEVNPANFDTCWSCSTALQ